MKYRINNIKIPVQEGKNRLKAHISKKIGVSEENITIKKILKESIDARKKI